MSTTSAREDIIYVIYDIKDGRILARYSHYDATDETCHRCELEDVRAAIQDASTDLKTRAFDILELKSAPNVEVRDVRVDLKTKQLVSRATRTKEHPR